MDKQEMVHITIFQAPFASLIERGLYMKMYDLNHTFQEQVPAEYYLAAFKGAIECPAHLPEDSSGKKQIAVGIFTGLEARRLLGAPGGALMCYGRNYENKRTWSINLMPIVLWHHRRRNCNALLFHLRGRRYEIFKAFSIPRWLG